MTNDPIAAYAARLRAEANDPERAERLREDRRRRRRKIAAIAAGGALALGGLGFWLVTATDGERPANEPFAPGMLQEAMWPADWPVTIRMPYRSSPAARWKSGAEDMVPPSAKPVGRLTAPEVEAGLEAVRGFLEEANFSEDTLEGEGTEGALELLAPGDPARSLLEDLPGRGAEGRDPLRLVTRFDPEEVYVVEEPRVQGSMAYEATPEGELLVHADYTIVYAVVMVEGGWIVGRAEEATRVVVRRVLDTVVRDGKLAPRTYAALIANDDCTAPDDGFVHPLFSRELAEKKNWKKVDPYAAGSRPGASTLGACLMPTRT
ncbi:hypothetical protein [Streptomyces laurentii]|uniref:hypothetical protein n=1 Tax=Streptomyces laurentii TaxID=39478 RepID=UPI0036B394E4